MQNGQAPSMSEAAGRRIARPTWAFVLISAFLYLALANHLPVGVLADASHDDGWFYQRSRALAAGHWLGRFSQMTLIKGPGYPAFAAINGVLGLPVTFTQALLYLAACGLFALTAGRLARSRVLGLGVYLLLLWHPALFPTRLVRDDIYGAQSLIYIACLIHLLFLVPRGRRRVLWAVIGGLDLAWLWLTREEGVWIIPATLVLVAAGLWRDRSRAGATLLAGATAVAAGLLVAILNLAVYRTFATVDFKSASFTGAVNALQSVRVGEPTPYVPVPAKVREQIYAVSPTFASLRPYLDTFGRSWTLPGCQVYPTTCGDYAGGWFVWALRDAVAWAGHYGSAADAARFYDRIAAEVRGACRSGRLQCDGGLVPFMPGVTAAQWRTAPAKVESLGAMLLQPERPAPPDSSGPPSVLADMWNFEGLPRRTPAKAEQVRALSGWFYARNGGWIELGCRQGARTWIVPIARRSSADIAVHFNDAAATDRRFAVDLPSDADCSLQPTGAPANALPYASLREGQAAFAGAALYLDSVGIAGSQDQAAAIRILGVLTRLYRAGLPWLALTALAGLAGWIVQRARGRTAADQLAVVCLALWLFVGARGLVLVLVDISAFPAVVTNYVAASAPLFCATLLLTAWLPLRARSGSAETAPAGGAGAGRGLLQAAATSSP